MDPYPSGDVLRLNLLNGGNWPRDLSMMGAGPSALLSAQNVVQKRKRSQVASDASQEYLPYEEDLHVEIGSCDKNKQPMVADEDPVALVSSIAYAGTENGASSYAEKLEADISDYEEPDDDYYYYDYEIDEEYDGDYDDAAINVIDNYENLTAKFDSLDLPPGVEASVSWLLSSEDKRSSEVVSSDIEFRYKLFKQFDSVENFEDHAFSKSPKMSSKDWVNQIQQEWRVLENDLPETIFVRVSENRMDLLRAAIVGPVGTPYHNALFFFDVWFPPEYPKVPPRLHYHSGGLRLNPNLYSCGKVCLSLLGTWTGSGCEMWKAGKSTMLQVLVSIQGLVLNEHPYFNEPGYSRNMGTAIGNRNSMFYNETVFILSCKTMLYVIRKPLLHFQDLVYGHFHKHGRSILIACLAYIGGAQVGSPLPSEVPDVALNDSNMSNVQNSLIKLYEDLLLEFTVKGADCDEFLAKKKSVKKAGKTEETQESTSSNNQEVAGDEYHDRNSGLQRISYKSITATRM